MFTSMNISASAMTAERLRLDVISSNLASQDAITASGTPYQRHMAVLQTLPNGGVYVSSIVVDGTPGPQVFDPTSPLANAQGYVQQSNVNSVQEMVDLLAATRSYQANVTAFDAGKTLAMDAIGVLA